MKPNRRARGSRGEAMAARFLENRGFEILHRNLNLSHQEIDLVCLDNDCLVFVEVKFAQTDSFGHPATWVDARKQEHLRTAAQRFLQEYDFSGYDIRFDVVAILGDEIEYYPGAF